MVIFQWNFLFQVLQGRYFINRRLQPTVHQHTTQSPARDDTLLIVALSVVPAGLRLIGDYRRLKPTVNKVSSLAGLEN
jgi:hypothetical protein